MREGTSGFWLEAEDGKIAIGYADYGVSEFGGSDFEKTYYLDEENTKKFVCALKEKYKGSLEDMIEAAFGRGFDDSKFWSFCRAHAIEYTTSSWRD